MYHNLDQDIDKNCEKYGMTALKEKHSPVFVNNIDFYQGMNVLHYLRDIGKVLRMGPMLSKEIVANRLKS